MKSQRSRVFRGGNQTKGSRDIEKKGKRDIKLASFSKYKRSTEISRVSQLLLAVYQGFYQSSSTIAPTSKEGRKVEMRKRVKGSIPGHEESIYIRTSTSSTRSGQKNMDQS